MSTLLEDCSPSHTITLGNLMKLKGEETRRQRLAALARANIASTTRLFHHNRAHDIKVFRLTSRLVPLATHPLLQAWDWEAELGSDFKKLGDLARKDNLRLSAHPDHFTLLNSPREEVVEAAVNDLVYHHKILTCMGLDSKAKLVIHVGGSYREKESAAARFTENYTRLPQAIKDRIVLENDDKSFGTMEVLELCRLLKIPMVLDLHHHWCLNHGATLGELLPAIFATWQGQAVPPKVHLSSPKDEKNFRAHADYIDARFFVDFLELAREINMDFDVMCEAKAKDAALFRLMEELKQSGLNFINRATIEV